uniref:Cadherin domain-containing protein n=1 Tax=Anopheles epiroticus TaxID=199890 RepID=A0A182PP34_9DIPT
ILTCESSVPVPKIKPSGWNWADVSPYSAVSATFVSNRPERMSENAQCLSAEHGHDLFRVFVEHGRVLVIATRQDFALIGMIDVQCQYAGHTGRMQAGMGSQREEAPQLLLTDQFLRHGAALLLALLRKHGRFVLQLLDHLRTHARLFHGLGRHTTSFRCDRRLRSGLNCRHARLWFQGSQRFSRSRHFFVKTGNNTTGSIVLVECMRQLLPGGLQLLSLGKRVEHHIISLDAEPHLDENPTPSFLERDKYRPNLKEEPSIGVTGTDANPRQTIEYSFLIATGQLFDYQRDFFIGGERRRRNTFNSLNDTGNTLSVNKYTSGPVRSDNAGGGNSGSSRESYIDLELLRDNRKPSFVECDSYKPVLNEEQPVGTSVLRVTATDPDPRQTIEYSFVTTPGERARFRIDKITGEITTNHVFDRDEPIREKEIYITVRATDNGRPRLDDVCTFKVTILDINDNPPVFDKVRYEESVTKDMKANLRVATISAADMDDGVNSIIKYELLENLPDSSFFKINKNNGVLTINKTVDRVPGQYYSIRVRAYNMNPQGIPIHNEEVDVKIRVVESNKRQPLIHAHKETVVLNESFKDYTQPLATLQADSCIPDKPEVIFELILGRTVSTNLNHTFLLEQINNTAMIKLGTTLDYETMSEYTLTVSVRNSDDMIAEASLKINVLDDNDNIPVFVDVTSGTIPEGEPPGTHVIQVQAYDLDGTPANNIVSYRFDDENQQLFHIDNRTGIITSLVEFDREQSDSFQLKLVAEDNSPSALYRNGKPNSVSKLIFIKVLDKNDNKPMFITKQFVVEEVPEDENINTAVIEVTARDPDATSLISYTIVSGNEGNAFKIDKNMGRISINSRLDYETVPEYRLVVQADDGTYQDNTTVFIKVKNVNDNPPRFTEPLSVTIQEETIPFGCIMIIQAYDPDIENRDDPQHIQFFYVNDGGDVLAIDDHGCMRLNKPLDRDPPQGFNSWQFIIIATDEDGEGKQTPATVNIYLEDINDNAPRLSNAMPVVWGENRSPGLIVRLTAEDVDEAQNGPPFHFSIDPNAPYEIKERFQVQGDELYALVEFDREEQKEYRVPIRISDSGEEPMSDVSILQLVIGDDNDNEMRPGESRIFVYNYKGESPNTEIGRVYVDDPDDWDLPDKTFQWDDATRHQSLGGAAVNLDYIGSLFNWTYVPQDKGFTGCLRNLTINEKTYDLGLPSLAKNADPGCQRSVAAAISFGIDSYFLIAIIACMVVLLVLLLAVVVHKRQNDEWHDKDMNNPQGTIAHYEVEGGGEGDTIYDINALLEQLTWKAPDASQYANINDNYLKEFLRHRVANCDQHAFAKDDLRCYAYEEDENSYQSLSSLTSCSSDEADGRMLPNLTFMPNLQMLASIYGEETSDTEE